MAHPVASTSRIDARTHVGIGAERVTDGGSGDFPGHYYGEDAAWDLEKMKERLNVTINRLTADRIEFDLVGVDASVANALRRILIAEVPTVAIEQVFVFNNTTIVQDEVLAQRLGLIPLKVDPRTMRDRPDAEPYTDKDTLNFKLRVQCKRRAGADPEERDPTKLYVNAHVTSAELKFKGEVGPDGLTVPTPVTDDILLAKMRPGQIISLEMFAQKGIGKEHAKWSPVSTASYRLMPSIDILEPIPSDLCDKFAKCFSPGVIEVATDRSGQKTARVKDPRRDTVSREVLRHNEFKDKVALGRIRDHFILESVGQYKPEDLFLEAAKVLLEKIDIARTSLDQLFVSEHELEEEEDE